MYTINLYIPLNKQARQLRPNCWMNISDFYKEKLWNISISASFLTELQLILKEVNVQRHCGEVLHAFSTIYAESSSSDLIQLGHNSARMAVYLRCCTKITALTL